MVFYDARTNAFYEAVNCSFRGQLPTCGRGRKIELGVDTRFTVSNGLSSRGWREVLEKSGYVEVDASNAMNPDFSTTVWELARDFGRGA